MGARLGKPLEFNYTDADFAKAYLPSVRMAFALLGMRQKDIEKYVTGLMQKKDGEQHVAGLLDWLEIVHHKFSAIGTFVKAAHARVIIARQAVVAKEERAHKKGGASPS